MTDAEVSFRDALKLWTRIGFLSFGGPAGQIALMHREIVENRGWLEEEEFLHALNFCMLLPGPEAMQLATYAGWKLHGIKGGLAAGLLFILPGFFVMLALSIAYALFADTTAFGVLFHGLKAAVLAVVAEALIRIGKKALKTGAQRLIAGLAFFALFAFALPFPLVILAAALFGWWRGRGGAPAEAASTMPGAWRQGLTTISIWLAVWAALPLALLAAFGPASVYQDISLFFSRMAVVTFGGAYAVLSYVAQAAVGAWHWMTPGQMLDGLALAETTPGPLILVLCFVGFRAGMGSGLPPLWGGTLGAFTTAWVTFVPCFLWIFLGAPHLERLRRNTALSSALSTVTAAVAGVVLNLAVWFALHALFAETATTTAGPFRLELPVLPSFDPLMAGLALFAGVLLLRLKVNLVAVLALTAGAGAVIGGLLF